MEKIIDVKWHSSQQMLVAKLSGKLNAEDIRHWNNLLLGAMDNLNDNSVFKIVVDLHGFEAEDMEVHKQFRTIIPALLADYNYRIGYLDMFPEANIELKQTRGIRCIAMANVHHNAEKMLDYQTRFGNEHEHYFTESDMALAWIKKYVSAN
ncbi:hypothetical protein WG954_14940 [Lacibacter sp. H375]|uniref:hypothetical protein n=1 Tax=Lacibacter sp. H375 TaxID=3133424 RepID=UPI0030C59855